MQYRRQHTCQPLGSGERFLRYRSRDNGLGFLLTGHHHRIGNYFICWTQAAESPMDCWRSNHSQMESACVDLFYS